MQQLDLFSAKPAFGGATFEEDRDGGRLRAQYNRVFNLMKDGRWRTLSDIEAMTHDPQGSISARLRDMRKPKFGGHVVERKRLLGGLFVYRVVADSSLPCQEPL